MLKFPVVLFAVVDDYLVTKKIFYFRRLKYDGLVYLKIVVDNMLVKTLMTLMAKKHDFYNSSQQYQEHLSIG